MSEDGPNYSRNIVQRRQLVPVFAVMACVTSVASMVLLLERPLKQLGGLAATVIIAAVAVLVTWLAGFTADRIHRSLWPEHPDEG